MKLSYFDPILLKHTFRSINLCRAYLVGSVTTLSIIAPGRGFPGPLLLWTKNLALIRFVTITNANGTELAPFNCPQAIYKKKKNK